MARKTYLELVNEVLVMLREEEVSTVQLTNYSKLIGKIVNDAKKTVENSYNWNALSETIAVSTVANTFSYSLTNTSPNFRLVDVINNTNDHPLRIATSHKMNMWLLNDSRQTGEPHWFNFNGTDTNGNTVVDLYPVPDATYSIFFNIVNPQAELVDDTDTIQVPADPVIALAYAKALVERGEDGGLGSSEAYAIYKGILADSVAIESSRYLEEAAFIPV